MIAPVTSLQPRYSLLHREVETEILPHCQSEGIGVIVYSPMASGLLTGAMNRDRIASLPKDDWRKGHSDFNEPHLSRYLALVDGVTTVCVTGVHTVDDQNVALRLVALTDRLYDAGIPVLASGERLDRIFGDEMLAGGFRKKYLRATSRLLALSAAVNA